MMKQELPGVVLGKTQFWDPLPAEKWVDLALRCRRMWRLCFGVAGILRVVPNEGVVSLLVGPTLLFQDYSVLTMRRSILGS